MIGGRSIRDNRVRGKSRSVSKTERIASVFIERPLQPISPKEISRELDLDIQLVTSIVSRLRAEGLIERIGWGKYKLRMDNTFEPEKLITIARDLHDLTSGILGTREDGHGEVSEDHSFDYLVDTYRAISQKGGEAMAANLLRLSARKLLSPEETELLIISLREVKGK